MPEGLFTESTTTSAASNNSTEDSEKKHKSPSKKDKSQLLNHKIAEASVARHEAVEECARTSNYLMLFEKKNEIMKEIQKECGLSRGATNKRVKKYMYWKINKMREEGMDESKFTDTVSISSSDSRDSLHDMMDDFLHMQRKYMDVSAEGNKKKKHSWKELKEGEGFRFKGNT